MENSDDDLIVVDALFVGMTRPATVLGVPYSAVVVEGILVAIIFLAANNPLYLLLALPIHAVLYLIGAADPGIFSAIFTWAKTSARCLNSGFWGAASFSPLSTKKWRK